MFEPKYIITNKTLTHIGKIEAAKEIIENAPLVPNFERDFVKDAQIRSVHYSTHLEGNELNFPEVKKIIEGFGDEVVARDRDVYEVLNYREAVRFIEEVFEKAKGKKSNEIIDLDILLKLHKILSKNILSSDRQGSLRIKNADLISSKNFEQILVFPKPTEVKTLLTEFLRWLASNEALDTHPILKSGIAHFELTKIHPFDDQNGRTARALSTLILYLDGYNIKSFFSLDERFDTNPMGYYNALGSIQKNGGDFTEWLEYFSLNLAIELTRVKEKVLKLSKEGKLRQNVGQVALSERQEKIVNHITDYGFVTGKIWRKLFTDYSDDTILRDIQDLIKRRVIKKVGSTKSARYVMR